MMVAELDLLEERHRHLGFRVAFDWAGDGFLRSDCLPDRTEYPCPTEEKAWELARRLLAVTSNATVKNVYVVDGKGNPVPDYRKKMLRMSGRAPG